jgi:predicted metal-dependent HD superfamily phosphohydrolase
MASQLVKDTKKYVVDLLKEGLTSDHLYHNVEHTLTAQEAVLVLADKYHLPEDEAEVLALAALFHDTGFTKTYDGHEDESIEFATAYLKGVKYPEENIEKVISCIEVTKIGIQPQNLLQKIIKDADFNNFGEQSYHQKGDALRHEWEVFRNLKMNDDEWLENNFRFWSNHKFYTGEAQVLFGKAKKNHLKKLAKTVDKLKQNKEEKTTIPSILEGNKSAQMMFKTTLRNHIDLTSIADNKANMMLSISALIITIAMPLLAGNLKGNPFLLWPTACLMLTSILSIIYATLATRPVKTPGITDLNKIPKGETNLFFYGNFYKMTLDDYKKGIREVSGDDNILDNSVVMDLFFLGKALGQKFQLLRRCYSVFMIGMTITVIAFAVSFIIVGGGN